MRGEQKTIVTAFIYILTVVRTVFHSNHEIVNRETSEKDHISHFLVDMISETNSCKAKQGHVNVHQFLTKSCQFSPIPYQIMSIFTNSLPYHVNFHQSLTISCQFSSFPYQIMSIFTISLPNRVKFYHFLNKSCQISSFPYQIV